MENEEPVLVSDIPLFFGRYLVHRGLVTDHDLNEALAVQSELNGSVACTAMEVGLISAEDFIRCRRYQREHAVTFIEALRSLKRLDDEGCRLLQKEVAERHVPIGAILVMQGKLTQAQLQAALSESSGSRFI